MANQFRSSQLWRTNVQSDNYSISHMDKCYLCGSTKNLTRDHVPPEGFFPPPKPTNLITLPCCEDCHRPLSLQDEAFRLWVASVANASDAGLWILRNRVIGSSFKRSPKLFEMFVSSRQCANCDCLAGR